MKFGVREEYGGNKSTASFSRSEEINFVEMKVETGA
jgi:hypothetical protein